MSEARTVEKKSSVEAAISEKQVVVLVVHEAEQRLCG